MTSSEQTLELLRRFESRNITYIDPRGGWPIVWERAKGCSVWDAEGRRYLDLTAAFGVAVAGHANARVIKAGQRQMGQLLHAMGDVHPHALKARLARELSRITFERWSQGFSSHRRGEDGVPGQRRSEGKTIFCNSGFEAVEAALKTAALATGKKGIIAFEGGYHGLGYGALNATHRRHFRERFAAQLGQFGHFVPFPGKEADLGPLERSIRRLLKQRPIGAILVEPIQVRAGINVPPAPFLGLLREICTETRPLLILDEIYTGFGRTGKWFACEHSGIKPDLICLGKALTGGFPLSACVGRTDLMDNAWPASLGEAIHTSTFLGHPVGCAMALANLEEIQAKGLVERAGRLGPKLLAMLDAVQIPKGFKGQAKGVGLLIGLELQLATGQPATDRTLALIKAMLEQGYILLPEAEHANVIAFTPPLTITAGQLEQTVSVLETLLGLS